MQRVLDADKAALQGQPTDDSAADEITRTAREVGEQIAERFPKP